MSAWQKAVLAAGLLFFIILVILFYAIYTTNPPASASSDSPNSSEKAAVQPARLRVEPAVGQTPALILTPSVLSPPISITHTVKSGEFLGQIAYTYGATVEAIMAANHLTDPHTLQIGQILYIPTMATPSLPTPTLPIMVYQIYEVQPGDTLLALAFRHRTTVEAILALNPGLIPTLLQVGQPVRIPKAAAVESAKVEEQATVESPTITHEIVRGDTLLALATKYNTSVAAILAANPGLNPTLLQIGQQLIIPRERPAATAAAPSPVRVSASVVETPVLSAPVIVLEAAMFAAVNDERAGHGLAPYISDAVLTQVARAHAQDMVTRRYFSHVTPEGKTLRDRLREAGIEKHWVGENIQSNTLPVSESAQMAMIWFMDSPPHRDNILAEAYTRLGVGVAEGPVGWYTFVLVFAGES